MAKRKAAVELPEHVHRVTSRGKDYYYFVRNRGTANATKPVPLPRDPWSAEFGQKYDELLRQTSKGPIAYPPGSIGALIVQYAGKEDDPDSGSPEWLSLALGTRETYRIYLNRMLEWWGTLPASGLRAANVLAYRDTMKDTPFAANTMLAVGTTAFQWGVPRDYCTINPFREIKRLDTGESGHIPWPEWAYDFAIAKAWPDLSRFVFLAMHTGQRESDVIRLGPEDRDGSGISTKPKKTGKKYGRIWIPMTISTLLELDRMEREPVTFVNPRFKAPIVLKTEKTYVFSPRGTAYTPDSLRSRWGRWINGTDDGKELVRRWREYCRHLTERAGEVFDEDEAQRPALHGLRASAVVIRRMAGATHQQISNDIGMSLQMVMRYTRFMDQRAAAEANIVLLEEAERRRKGAQ